MTVRVVADDQTLVRAGYRPLVDAPDLARTSPSLTE